MTKFALIFLLAGVAAPASAMCHDFEMSGSLGGEYIICYDDKCDLSRQTVICSGGGPNFAEYNTGWRFGYEHDVQQGITHGEYTSWNGKVLSKENAARVRVFKVKDGTALEVLD